MKGRAYSFSAHMAAKRLDLGTHTYIAPVEEERGCTCHDPKHHPDPNCPECKRVRDRYEIGYQ